MTGKMKAAREATERAEAERAMIQRVAPSFAMGWAMVSEAVATWRGKHWRMTDEQLKQLGGATVECLIYYGGGPLAKHAPLLGLAFALGNWALPAFALDIQRAKEAELERQRAAALAQRPAPPVRHVDEDPKLDSRMADGE